MPADRTENKFTPDESDAEARKDATKNASPIEGSSRRRIKADDVRKVRRNTSEVPPERGERPQAPPAAAEPNAANGQLVSKGEVGGDASQPTGGRHTAVPHPGEQ